MINHFYLDKLKESQIAGNESLSVVEQFKFMFKNLSLDIDKKLAFFNKSIHIINVDEFTKKTKSKLYLDRVNDLLPIPALYNSKTMVWEDYVNGVLKGVNLVSTYKDDVESLYRWLRQIATTSKVPMSFKYKITNTQAQIDAQLSFIKTLSNPSNKEKETLGTLYNSFNQATLLMADHNSKVSLIKGRDVEIIAKQIQLNAELANVILKKIEVSDITLSPVEVDFVKRIFHNFEIYSNVVGGSLGLINELSAVFEGQIKSIK